MTRSVYVHVPYCVRRCPYCDFSISLFRNQVPPARYLRCLEAEVARLPRTIAPRTLFVGGGTPTALKPADLDRFYRILGNGLDLSRLVESSIEANPENLRADRIEILLQHGVTRISLGAQSFEPETLDTLGRQHDAEQIEQAVLLARAAGVRVISIDLIFGVPGQNRHQLERDVDRLLALEPDHISAYCLTYEQDTAITSLRDQGLVLPLDEDTELDFYRRVRDRLSGAGYCHYEVSNFARPGSRCIHNLTYWHNRPYLGLGPSAVTYADGERRKNQPDLAAWCEAIENGTDPVVERETLPIDSSLKETVMLGLRLRAGVRRLALERRFGLGFEALDPKVLAEFADATLLDWSEDRIRLTDRGVELADGIAAALL